VARADEKLTAFYGTGSGDPRLRRIALTRLAKFSEKVFSQILQKTLLNKERIQTMKPLIKFKATTLLFISLVLSCFALCPRARAQAVSPDVSPAPDGFYKGFNTAEGFNALLSLTNGTFNTALGFAALKADTSGSHNTAMGVQALLHNNGSFNTAIGENALVANTTGSFNMALGHGALAKNLTGSANTAQGFQALNANTADNNTAVGFQALKSNTTGSSNTATGAFALNSNTTGFSNTANGQAALDENTNGSNNTAAGFAALFFNTTGSDNTATGGDALNSNTIGARNTAMGVEALSSNTRGNFNTASGDGALRFSTTGSNNTAVGGAALGNNDTGNLNIALGFGAGLNVFTANNVIAIGSLGADISNTCFIGHIRGVTTHNANAIPVLIDSAGQLGTASSSRRFKKEIEPMDHASEAILALKPVTFHYKSDSTNTPQFGLIAEEVAKVNPDLVVRDENGEIYTVRYDAVNAMLLNEFLKEHQKVEKLEATVAQQQKDFQATAAKQQQEIKALTASLKEQATLIQKVSDKIEVSKPAPQTAFNE
jgi:Chaperone of endosialidase